MLSLAKAAQRRILYPFASATALLLLVGSCSAYDEGGPVRVAAIGEVEKSANLAKGEVSSATMVLLDATAQGLVSFDGEGQIEPGLAERWTVTADGRSYIFRIREAKWPNGKKVTAQQVAAALKSYLAPRSRHPLREDFVEVENIHAMTDSVIEIRLSVPQPFILELLAQPAMAIAAPGSDWDRGWGPMRVHPRGNMLRFTPIADPLAEDTEAAEARANDPARSVDMIATTAPRALARFKNGYADAVLGGSYATLPYFQSSGIARSRLLIDPVAGLFGLAFANDDGFLAEPAHRAALASLIRADRLIKAFDLSDWLPQSGLRPAATGRSALTTAPVPTWTTEEEESRLSGTRQLISQWKADGHSMAPLRIALPDGPGSLILFAYIAADLARADVKAVRVGLDAPADLRLIDEVAPNDDAIWPIRRLNCRADTLCSESLAAQIDKANTHIDNGQRLELIAETEAQMMQYAAFIPLAVPLRWSVTSLRLTGLRPNSRAHHPLNRLIATPN